MKEQQIWWNDIFENRIEMDSKYYVHADTDKADDEQPAPVILRQWVELRWDHSYPFPLPCPS